MGLALGRCLAMLFLLAGWLLDPLPGRIANVKNKQLILGVPTRSQWKWILTLEDIRLHAVLTFKLLHTLYGKSKTQQL